MGLKMIHRFAILVCLLPLLVSASKPIPGSVKPRSNPAAAQSQRTGNDADLAFKQSTFGRDLVNKVKKGAIYIWAMAPDPNGFLQPAWIGSGFIFQAIPEENAAYALTNHHVAQNTTLLQCETWDHSTYKAEFVALEPGIDVALIKIMDIAPGSYEVNVLGDSDKVQIGEPALAMGAPGSGDSFNADRTDPYISFGLHQTATMRVVAGKQTDPMEFISTRPYWQGDLGWQVMSNTPWRFVCQSTINGGNSGGPLYNAQGEVIGLNHAHFGAGSVITQNQNYTIPINFAKNFAYQILNTGKYEIPWFGMDMLIPSTETQPESVTEWEEKHYDPRRMEVLGVRRDSPAAKAGLQRGDRIVEFDGQTFPTTTDLRLYIFTLPIGKQVPVTVKRGGVKAHLMLEVAPKRKYDAEFSL
jgi:S1-C subfamily serine protease